MYLVKLYVYLYVPMQFLLPFWKLQVCYYYQIISKRYFIHAHKGYDKLPFTS